MDKPATAVPETLIASRRDSVTTTSFSISFVSPGELHLGAAGIAIYRNQCADSLAALESVSVQVREPANEAEDMAVMHESGLSFARPPLGLRYHCELSRDVDRVGKRPIYGTLRWMELEGPLDRVGMLVGSL